jgi:hypothetical protein
MPALDVKEPSWLGLVVCGSECVCFVQGVFVWWCQLRLVMYYCFFFLNDRAVLLLTFSKKKATRVIILGQTSNCTSAVFSGTENVVCVPICRTGFGFDY